MQSVSIASDLSNPDFVGARNPDDLAIVRFYATQMENPYKSSLEGRPIYDTVDFVLIQFPGDTLSINDRPVTDYDKVRWPRQWAHYQSGKTDDAAQGTPLSNWPILKANQVAELNALGFHTIDQVAGSSDAQIGRIGMIAGMNAYGFRDAAIRFLALAQNASVLEQQVAANKRQEEVLAQMKEKFEAQEREMAEMRAMLENATAPERRGPGRPRKEEAA